MDDLMKLQQESLAKNELARQETVFPIFRLYDDADEILSTVVEFGGHVAAKASRNKEAAETAALATEQEAQQVVASARELMTRAPIGKKRAAVDAIKQDLGGLESGLSEVHQLVEKGAYIGAETQAKSVKEKGGAIVEELRQAIEKTRGKDTHISGVGRIGP
jgi:predicted enzyme related to lactoylglutathione lyase